MYKSSLELSMASRSKAISLNLMNVGDPQPYWLRFDSRDNLGFTKEQSLAGIVAWFDFWLSQ